MSDLLFNQILLLIIFYLVSKPLLADLYYLASDLFEEFMDLIFIKLKGGDK